jgi:copper(I)-binding protein
VHHLRTAHAALVAALAACAGSAPEGPPPPVRVEAPVAYVAPSGTAAVYFRIVNPGRRPDRLIAVESEAADAVEMHESVKSGDVVRMVSREDGFAVPARGAVELARGGKHLMVLGLRRPDAPRIPLTLRFERSAPVVVEAPVSREP